MWGVHGISIGPKACPAQQLAYVQLKVGEGKAPEHAWGCVGAKAGASGIVPRPVWHSSWRICSSRYGVQAEGERAERRHVLCCIILC